jgi:hypothetical protein
MVTPWRNARMSSVRVLICLPDRVCLPDLASDGSIVGTATSPCCARRYLSNSLACGPVRSRVDGM